MLTVLAYILGIVIIALGLAGSIALHELGHLVPAKRFGVRVSQYMVGFGPTLWSRKKGETEYGIKAIPLGGYISMSGMYPPSKSTGTTTRRARLFDSMVQEARDASADTIVEDSRTFYRLPIGKRLIIMFGGPFMNLLIAIVLMTIILCGIGIQQQTTTVGSISQCVVAAGSTQTECAATDPVTPAVAAGIQVGDRIVSVDGQAVSTWDEAVEIIQANAAVAVPFVVERDGTMVDLEVTPIANTVYVVGADGVIATDANGDKVTTQAGFVGIGSQVARVQQPFGAVFTQLGSNLITVGQSILTLPQKVYQSVSDTVQGQARDQNSPSSIVGLGLIAGEVTSTDQFDLMGKVTLLLSLLASLNLFLFAFNMIPLPPLDGGHIATALWEGIKRSWARLRGKADPGPVDAARLVPITLTVAVVIGAMGAIMILVDLVNPIKLFG